MLVTVANSEFAAANSEFARFNILVLITNIRTSLTMTSMILRSVYLLTYLRFALKLLSWSSCDVGLGLALGEHGLGLETCGLVNIPAKLAIRLRKRHISVVKRATET